MEKPCVVEGLLLACLLGSPAGCARPGAPAQAPEAPEPAVARAEAPEPAVARAEAVEPAVARAEAVGTSRPPRVVREVAGRAPEIEVLARHRPRRNRFTDDVPPQVSVLGADLAAGEVLLREWQWVGYARSADYVETISVLDLARGRPRQALRAAGREQAAGGGELVLGSYTGSFAGDARRAGELMARYRARYWGLELVELSPDRERLAVFEPRSRALRLLDRRGRPVRDLVRQEAGAWDGPAAFSPDGARLAIVSPDRDRLLVVDLATGEVAETRMERAGNPIWSGPSALFVTSHRQVTSPDGDFSFEVRLLRVRPGPELAVEELLRVPAWVTRPSLHPDPAGETAVLLLPSAERTARGAEIGVLWLRLADGALLAERALPPYSEVALVADGPIVVSSHDPDLHDGRGRTDDVLTLLDLASGDRVELTPDLVGGHLRGPFRAEREGREAVLVARQPDAEAPSFEVVRIDLASAFPR